MSEKTHIKNVKTGEFIQCARRQVYQVITPYIKGSNAKGTGLTPEAIKIIRFFSLTTNYIDEGGSFKYLKSRDS